MYAYVIAYTIYTEMQYTHKLYDYIQHIQLY